MSASASGHQHHGKRDSPAAARESSESSFQVNSDTQTAGGGTLSHCQSQFRDRAPTDPQLAAPARQARKASESGCAAALCQCGPAAGVTRTMTMTLRLAICKFKLTCVGTALLLVGQLLVATPSLSIRPLKFRPGDRPGPGPAAWGEQTNKLSVTGFPARLALLVFLPGLTWTGS